MKVLLPVSAVVGCHDGAAGRLAARVSGKVEGWRRPASSSLPHKWPPSRAAGGRRPRSWASPGRRLGPRRRWPCRPLERLGPGSGSVCREDSGFQAWSTEAMQNLACRG